MRRRFVDEPCGCDHSRSKEDYLRTHIRLLAYDRGPSPINGSCGD